MAGATEIPVPDRSRVAICRCVGDHTRRMRYSAVLAVCATLVALTVSGPEAGGVSPEQPQVGDPVVEIGRTRWTDTNSIRLLAYPDEAWQVRLELIEQAQHNIHISTFSWHNDYHGKLFRKRLEEVMLERRKTNPDFAVYCLVDATARGMFDFSFGRLERAASPTSTSISRVGGSTSVWFWRAMRCGISRCSS